MRKLLVNHQLIHKDASFTENYETGATFLGMQEGNNFISAILLLKKKTTDYWNYEILWSDNVVIHHEKENELSIPRKIITGFRNLDFSRFCTKPANSHSATRQYNFFVYLS